MSIEQISQLTLNDCFPLLHSRLSEAGVSDPSDAQLQAEFDLYKDELIAEEDARLAGVARIDDLKSRFSELSDHGLLQAQGISNPAKYFQDSVLNAEPSVAEQNMLIMESNYDQSVSEMNADAWLKSRQSEYAKIDKMLLEGLAEDAAGRPEKLAEYLALREQIKLANPKPL